MSWVFNGSINQKETPAFYASSLATRPAFGFVGRIFIDTDTPSTGLYRDTGSAWVSIADPGAGTTGTLQQVTTNGNTTLLGINIGGASALNNILNVGGPTNGINYAINAKSNSEYGVVIETTSAISNDNGQLLLNSNIAGSISVSNSLIFTNSGKLGIGTVTPAQKLDVAGSAVFSGNIAIGTNTPINAGNDGRWITANGSTYSGGFIAAQNNVTKSIYYYDNVRNNAVIFNPATVGIDLIVNNSGTPVLNLATGNIANFAGRVNVNGAVDNATYQLNVSGNILANELLLNTNLTVVSGGKVFVNNAGYFVDGGFSAYIGSSGVGAGNDIIAYTSAIERFRIKTGGASVFAGTLGINGVENNVTNGDYTPTVVPITNLGAAGNTAFTGHWHQVGDIVTFSFTFNYLNATAASQITCGLTIPTGAAFTTGSDGWGAASWSNFIVNNIGSCLVTARNGQAQIQLIWFQPAATTEGSITGVITYKKR